MAKDKGNGASKHVTPEQEAAKRKEAQLRKKRRPKTGRNAHQAPAPGTNFMKNHCRTQWEKKKQQQREHDRLAKKANSRAIAMLDSLIPVMTSSSPEASEKLRLAAIAYADAFADQPADINDKDRHETAKQAALAGLSGPLFNYANGKLNDAFYGRLEQTSAELDEQEEELAEAS